jgi:hypothetical protein
MFVEAKDKLRLTGRFGVSLGIMSAGQRFANDYAGGNVGNNECESEGRKKESSCKASHDGRLV